MTLRERVYRSLDTASNENGFDMMGDAEMIVADLLECDPEFEGISDDDAVEILGYIQDWQKEQVKFK